MKRDLDATRHRLRMFGGAWATDTSHLGLLHGRGAAGVRLVLQDGTELEASVATFLRYGEAIDFDDPQVALPERLWQVTRQGARQLHFAFFSEVPVARAGADGDTKPAA